MVQKYPGFHGMNNRWMEKADFNKDGKINTILDKLKKRKIGVISD